MHARITTYTEMATATHTALGNALSALAKAKSLLGPQAESFLDNLCKTKCVKKHCKGHQATSKGSPWKAKSEASAKILMQLSSGSCLMGEDFVEMHTKLAIVHNTVSTAASLTTAKTGPASPEAL